MEKIKLFCIPHAGCSASCFINWEEKLSDQVEVVPVELAGRGVKIDIPMYQDIHEVLEDIFRSFDFKEEDNFALYGHSSGAIIAYALACEMKKRYAKQPLHLFLSSICPPRYTNDEDMMLSQLTTCQLKQRLIDMGGMQEEEVDDFIFEKFFMPTMIGDMKILENYPYNSFSNDIDSDISILYGQFDDRVKNLSEWNAYTRGNCNLIEFEGGHFFQVDNEDEVLNYIENAMVRYLNK